MKGDGVALTVDVGVEVGVWLGLGVAGMVVGVVGIGVTVGVASPPQADRTSITSAVATRPHNGWIELLTEDRFKKHPFGT